MGLIFSFVTSIKFICWSNSCPIASSFSTKVYITGKKRFRSFILAVKFTSRSSHVPRSDKDSVVKSGTRASLSRKITQLPVVEDRVVPLCLRRVVSSTVCVIDGSGGGLLVVLVLTDQRRRQWQRQLMLLRSPWIRGYCSLSLYA